MNDNATNLESQIEAAKNSVALLTVQKTQWVEFTGPDAANYLHRMTSNHVEALAPSKGQHSLYMNAKGRLISELWLYRKSPETILVEIPETVAQKVSARLKIYKLNSQLEIHPQSWQAVTLTGPKTGELLAVLGLKAPTENYAHEEGQIGETNVTVIKRPAYYSDCFSILIHSEGNAELDTITRELSKLGGLAVDSENTDFMRIDCGIPAFGKDLTEEILPQEAYLEEDALHFDKGCYPGQETVAKIKYRGQVNRLMVKFQVNVEDAGKLDGAQPIVLRNAEKKAGVLTSFSVVNSQKIIGLGFVKRAQIKEGNVLDIEGAGTVTVTPLRS